MNLQNLQNLQNCTSDFYKYGGVWRWNLFSCCLGDYFERTQGWWRLLCKEGGSGKGDRTGKGFQRRPGGGFPLKEAVTPGIAVFDKTHLSRQVDSMLLLAKQISMINDKKRILANQRENQKEERIANPILNS